jgi:hypothetical protein
MAVRRLLVAAVSVTVALAAVGASIGAPDVEPQTTVYRLRADPRLCPSPVCGGFWASRVNTRLTTCLAGNELPACYVAAVDLSALTRASRARARAAVPTGQALVDGVFRRYPNGAFPQLATLVAARVWLAAGSGAGTGPVYRVVDTGVRCVRAPCFSLRATVVNTTRSLTLSDLDLAGTDAPPAAIARARSALAHAGVFVAGTVRSRGNSSGRSLAATQVWLPA